MFLVPKNNRTAALAAMGFALSLSWAPQADAGGWKVEGLADPGYWYSTKYSACINQGAYHDTYYGVPGCHIWTAYPNYCHFDSNNCGSSGNLTYIAEPSPGYYLGYSLRSSHNNCASCTANDQRRFESFDISSVADQNIVDSRIISIIDAIPTHPSTMKISNIHSNTSGFSATCAAAWAEITAEDSDLSTISVRGYDTSANLCMLSNGENLPLYSTATDAAWISRSVTAGLAVQRPDGVVYNFDCTHGVCTTRSDASFKLTASESGYTLIDRNEATEQYDKNGALQWIRSGKDRAVSIDGVVGK